MRDLLVPPVHPVLLDLLERPANLVRSVIPVLRAFKVSQVNAVPRVLRERLAHQVLMVLRASLAPLVPPVL